MTKDNRDNRNFTSSTNPHQNSNCSNHLGCFMGNLRNHTLLLTDVDGSIVLWNNGAGKMFGFEASEMVGHSYTELFLSNEDIPVQSVMATLVANESLEFELLGLRKDGSKFWASLELSTFDSAEGVVPVFGILISDITKHKQVEADLRDSKAMLHKILETIPNPVFAKDARLTYTECNPAFEHYIGLSRDRIVGSSLVELFERDKAEIYRKADQDLLLSKEMQSYESLVRYRDGSDRNVVFRKNVYLDANGNPQGIVGLIEDITDRKRAEEEHSKLTRIHQLLLDNSVFGISLVRHRVFQWTNNRTAEMVLHTVDQLKGASTRSFFPSNEVFEKFSSEAYPLIDRGEQFETTLLVPRIDGTKFWCRFIGKAITPGNPEDGNLWMFEDVTKQVTIEAENKRISSLHNLILSNSTFGIVFIRNRVFEWANQRTCELFNRSMDQLKGLDTQIIFPSLESYLQFGDLVYPSVDRDERVDVNYQFMRADGSLFWCRIIGRAIDSSKPQEGSIWFYEDITERLKSEEMLNVFQMFVENSKQGFGIASLDGVVRYTNPALKQIFSQLNEPKPADSYLVNSYLPIYQDLIKREVLPSVLVNGQWSGELTHKQRNGKPFYTQENFFLIRDTKGHPLYYGDVITDITERRIVEGVIKEERANLIALIENTTDRIWSVDKNFRVITINSNFKNDFYKAFGRLLEVGDLVLDFIPSDFVKTWRERYKKTLRGERFVVVDQFEYVGIPSYLEISFNPIVVDGAVVGAACFGRDISQLKRDEKELKESKARLLSLIENTEESIWSVDSNFSISTFNNRFKRRIQELLGLTVQIGASIEELPIPFQNMWKERLSTVMKGSRYTTVDRFIENNRVIYIEELLSPIVVDGNVTGVTCFSRDITQRKLAEEALQKSQSQLSLAMKLSMMCSWEYNVANNQFLFDDQFYSIYGDAESKAMGPVAAEEYFLRFVYPDDQPLVHDILKNNVANTAPIVSNQFEHRMVRSDGAIRHVVVVFTNIVDGNGQSAKFVGAIQDVTDLKNSEIKLKEMNASKDKLFSIIAHDLRNPFNGLIGFSELLKMQVEEKDFSNIEVCANSLYSVSIQTYNLLENLLEWATSQQGRIQFNPSMLNLDELVNDVHLLLAEVAAKKNIHISAAIPAKVAVVADPNMLKTILRNLVSNAIKFTFPNGHIEINATGSSNFVTVAVSDNGTGMSRDTVATLFNIAANKSTLGTGSESGTGLGLLLCKDFVEKHGGTIWVESTLGEGTTFFFTLPVSLN